MSQASSVSHQPAHGIGWQRRVMVSTRTADRLPVMLSKRLMKGIPCVSEIDLAIGHVVERE